MELHFIVVYIGSWLGVSGGVYALFNRAGESVNKETKKKVSDWLQNLNLVQPSNWPNTFTDLFDRVFTKKHFSLGCFFRSAIASFGAVFIMIMLFCVVNKEPLVEIFSLDLKASILIVFGLNLFPDYVSLLETRYIIKKMGETQSVSKWFLFLVGDIIISGIIFFLVGFLAINFIALITKLNYISLSGFINYYLESRLSFKLKEEVFFYSTYFTSIWILLYFISSIILKIVSRFGAGLKFLQKHLDIENSPFKAMGFTLMLAVSICYIVVGLILLVNSR
jgi:hypothetical protein